MSRVNSSVERAVEITESDHRPTLTIEDACALSHISRVHFLAPDFAIFSYSPDITSDS